MAVWGSTNFRRNRPSPLAWKNPEPWALKFMTPIQKSIICCDLFWQLHYWVHVNQDKSLYRRGVQGAPNYTFRNFSLYHMLVMESEQWLFIGEDFISNSYQSLLALPVVSKQTIPNAFCQTFTSGCTTMLLKALLATEYICMYAEQKMQILTQSHCRLFFITLS